MRAGSTKWRSRLLILCFITVLSTTALSQSGDLHGPADQRGGEGLTDLEALFSKDGTLQAGPYVGLEANQDRVFDQVGVAAGYGLGIFGVAFDVMLINDDKYVPSQPYMFGHYFRLNEGMVSISPEPFHVRAGRIDHTDEVETPYSLFITSEDLPAVVADIEYDDDFFFYRTRWISLVRNWDFDHVVNIYEKDFETEPPEDDPRVARREVVHPNQVQRIPSDRGANYKAYGLRFGDFRFGVQESIVYLDQEFYPEYFFSPLPMYFTQLVNTRGDTDQNDEGEKPWTQERNENSFIGFFLDYRTPLSYAYFQFLMDDINLNSLAPGFDLRHPNKLAWSFGGRHRFDFGRLGFYHAGATKYTFEATRVSTSDEMFSVNPYEYTYYPTVAYGDNTLWYYDNYIGYKYGENNLAFMLTYDRSFAEFDLGGRLEYVVSGSKSPANPYHGQKDAEGTELFGEPQAEHTVSLGAELARRVGNWRLTAAPTIGYRFNQLELRNVDPDSADATQIDGAVPRVFRPSGGDRFRGSLFLGARYALNISSGTTWDTLFVAENSNGTQSDTENGANEREATKYEITDVNYEIDGRTQRWALDGKLEIEEGTGFASMEQVEAYIANKRQELRNQRVLSAESRIEYEILPRSGRPDAIEITVNAVDTWNLVALPYPKYDSNEGLLLGIRARDYNFFGTMEELRVDLDYENKIDGQDKLSGDEVWSLETTFDWPFQWLGHSWKWTLAQNLEFDSRTDIEYDLSTDLAYDFLIGARQVTATYSQAYDYLTSDKEGDGYFLTSGVKLGTSYDTGWYLPVMEELTYSPSLFTNVSYKLDDRISEERRGVEAGFEHSLEGRNVDWLGNFREGMRGRITNTNSVNLNDRSFARSMDAELAGYLAADPFGFSGRGLISLSLDEDDYANASPIRGILDDRYEGSAGAYLNTDVTLKVWTIGTLVEGQGSLFFDAGAIFDDGSGFDAGENLHAGAGIEAIGFPLFARSFYVRVSAGFDLREVIANGTLLERELFIGLGHHY